MQNNEPKFYICDKCQVIIEEIKGNKEQFFCSDTPLQKLVPNTSDGATEKHCPIIEQKDNKVTVKVGSTFHPMTSEHNIEWIYLKTKKGCQRINLRPDEEPIAIFYLSEHDNVIAAYSYCNLHGFWETQV